MSNVLVIAIVICGFILGWIIGVYMVECQYDNEEYEASDDDGTAPALTMYAVGFLFGLMVYAITKMV